MPLLTIDLYRRRHEKYIQSRHDAHERGMNERQDKYINYLREKDKEKKQGIKAEEKTIEQKEQKKQKQEPQGIDQPHQVQLLDRIRKLVQEIEKHSGHKMNVMSKKRLKELQEMAMNLTDGDEWTKAKDLLNEIYKFRNQLKKGDNNNANK